VLPALTAGLVLAALGTTLAARLMLATLLAAGLMLPTLGTALAARLVLAALAARLALLVVLFFLRS
jgi:hypothetical protein